jgi:hypothetical protein
MKPTKRHTDPLGRSTTRHRYSRYLLSLAIAITGSVWPIQARSIEAIFDTIARGRARIPLRRAPAARARFDTAPTRLAVTITRRRWSDRH